MLRICRFAGLSVTLILFPQVNVSMEKTPLYATKLLCYCARFVIPSCMLYIISQYYYYAHYQTSYFT